MAILSGSSSISMISFSSNSNFRSKDMVSKVSLFNVMLGEMAFRKFLTSSNLFSRVDGATTGFLRYETKTVQPVWITFDVTHNAVPGLYRGTVSITYDNKECSVLLRPLSSTNSGMDRRMIISRI